METINLLKQFYEETLERDWGVKYDSLTTNQLRFIEKTFSLTFWKARKAGSELAKTFNTFRKSSNDFTKNIAELKDLLTKNN